MGHIEELFGGTVELPDTVPRCWRHGSFYPSQVTHKLSSVLWLGVGWVVLAQWAALLGKAPPTPRLPAGVVCPPSILSGAHGRSVCANCVSPAPVTVFRCAVELSVCASI